MSRNRWYAFSDEEKKHTVQEALENTQSWVSSWKVSYLKQSPLWVVKVYVNSLRRKESTVYVTPNMPLHITKLKDILLPGKTCSHHIFSNPVWHIPSHSLLKSTTRAICVLSNCKSLFISLEIKKRIELQTSHKICANTSISSQQVSSSPWDVFLLDTV